MDSVTSSPHTTSDDRDSQPSTSGRRSWVFLLAVLLLPAVVAYVVASLSTKKYEAQAEVTHTIVNPSFGTTDRLFATQEVKARSRALADAVSTRLGLDGSTFVDALAIDAITAGINQDSTALRFSFKDEDPDLAQEAIQGYVDEYLASVEVVIDVPGLDGTAAEITKLQERRNDLLARMGAARDAGELPLAQELNDDYEYVVNDLGVQVALFNSLRPNTPVVVAEQLGTAWVSDGPVEPQPARAAALGLVAGLCIASALLLVSRRPRP